MPSPPLAMSQRPPGSLQTNAAGRLLPNGSDSRTLSLLLLDLYSLAESESASDFEADVFRRLTTYIDFDAGWTGVATLTDAGPLIHCSVTYQLPENFVPSWEAIRDCDPLVRDTQGRFGKACTVSGMAGQVAERFRRWASSHHLAQLMVACVRDTRLGLVSFASLYRFDANRPFSRTEGRRLEDVVPHVAAVLNLHRAARLRQRQARASDAPLARALCDTMGVIHHADPLFLAALRQEWPQHQDDRLPSPLLAVMACAPDDAFIGRNIRVACHRVAGLVELAVSLPSPLACLSPRERATLLDYGRGFSHKQVAQRLGITPTTVRHYLRNAYKKLGIHDKGEISQFLLRG